VRKTRLAQSAQDQGSSRSHQHPTNPEETPESEYDLKEILIAATLQGAIYSLVKSLIDRGGARAFQR